MDSRVTARFFRVSDKPSESDDFPDLLLAAMKQEKAGDRERNLDGGVTLRLERCAVDGEFVIGEFCRKQTTNIPPGAGPSGLAPIKLDKDHGLGHVAAFRYHKPTRVLLLQHNPQCASPNRIAAYIAAGNSAALFTFKPVLREDAWDRFVNKKIRSMQVRFSSPTNLEALDREGVAAAKGARLLAEAYDGLSVTITIGVGKKRKKFLNSISVESAITRILGSSAEVETVKVTTGSNDDDHVIDFLEEHLKVSQVLDLPDDSPDRHYEVRKSYLQQEFSGKLAYLKKHYGPKSDGNGS